MWGGEFREFPHKMSLTEAGVRKYLRKYTAKNGLIPEDHMRALMVAVDRINLYFMWDDLEQDEEGHVTCPIKRIIYEQVGDWELANKLTKLVVRVGKAHSEAGDAFDGMILLSLEHDAKTQATFDELAAKDATGEEIYREISNRLLVRMLSGMRPSDGPKEDWVSRFTYWTSIKNTSGEAGVRVIRLFFERLRN